MNTPITPKATPIYYKMMTYCPQKKSHKLIPGWYRLLFVFCVASFKPGSSLAHWDFELHSEGNLTLPATHLSWRQLSIGFPSLHRFFRCAEMIALQHDTHGIRCVTHLHMKTCTHKYILPCFQGKSTLVDLEPLIVAWGKHIYLYIYIFNLEQVHNCNNCKIGWTRFQTYWIIDPRMAVAIEPHPTHHHLIRSRTQTHLKVTKIEVQRVQTTSIKCNKFEETNSVLYFGKKAPLCYELLIQSSLQHTASMLLVS